MDKLIYHFGTNGAEGHAAMSNVLGSKGANLAEMSNLQLPIPPGFTITTAVCNYYYQHNYTLPFNLKVELRKAISQLERATCKVFGFSGNLLLSIRSGAEVSMPGMMDTILNLGMNDNVMENLANATNNRRFALDSYRRFLQMYGTTVLNIKHYLFDDVFESYQFQYNASDDNAANIDFLQNIITEFKKIIQKYSNLEFLEDPYVQLESAIIAVLNSWVSKRAIIYRKLHNIPDSLGTAVNVQSMVFGNKGMNSATGVVFTRSPSNGNNKIFGEFLINAQGEDIVSGSRTPLPITSENTDIQSMQDTMPETFTQLVDICTLLEKHYKDVQDIEFTVEDGTIFILQTRSAKRTAPAAIKIAKDMAEEGVISKFEALKQIDPLSLNQLLHTSVDYSTNLDILGQGLPASPGAATGIIVFSPYDAEELSHYHKVILVRHDTNPDDINGMHVSAGILTARGGMTSHAAVIARGMGKPCVCGASDIVIDENKKTLKIGAVVLNQGQEITIDGTNGKIFLGNVALVQPNFSKEFEVLLNWADEVSHLKIRANAETISDTKAAIQFGASGIGLCRTEHMFFSNDKTPLIQEMIIAPDLERRKIPIDKLLHMQTKEFIEIFRLMNNKPINIRLLDPPLHEFLPKSENDKHSLARNLNLPISAINHRLNALHEVNPMLGHRGCRLGITYPEIYLMQVEAIFTAIKELKIQERIDTILELMIPLINDSKELITIKEYIIKKVAEIENTYNIKFNFAIGTMIELPRAALLAESIAQEVSFFSFGTNDLTQTTFGISRDDVSAFLPEYLNRKIYDTDPFIKIDEEGVGELIKIAIERGKKGNNVLKFGVCGEHAGDPKSIEFFHRIGVDYVSCSPYRIPIARIAAAQAAIASIK